MSRPTAIPAGRGLADRLLAVATWGVAIAILGIFGWILADILRHGLGRIDWEFLTAAPRRAGRAGGIFPILVSTVLILLVTLAASLPLGLGTAVYLSQFTVGHSPRGRWIRRSLDLLAGVPSIVFGLFGNAVFCQLLGLGYSILSGGLTLACMVLPILIRTTEDSLRAATIAHGPAASALGLSRSTTLVRIILPAALPGLLAGLVLGLGRAIAETAALIFTAGYVDRLPHSLLDSGRSLSIHIYDLSMNVTGGNASAYAAALILVLLVLAINETATLILAAWRRRAGLVETRP